MDVARSVRGVVLAGGYTWNESAFDALAPRALLPVGHQPLIAWALWWLEEAGVRDVTICANPATSGPIERFVESAFPNLRTTLSIDASPRGPAGCVKDAVADHPAQTYVVVDGAVVPTVPLLPLLDSHLAADAAMTVVAHDDHGRGGLPRLRVPSGTYVCDDRALQQVPARGFFDIKENLIPRLYSLGEHVAAELVPGACPRVLNSATYLAVNHWLLDSLSGGEAPPGYVSLGDVMAHTSARIGVDAIITGPVLVGPEATIVSGATVVGPAVVGPRSLLERETLVSRSVLWERCVVARGAFVDRCVLADDSLVQPASRLIGAVLAGARKAPAAATMPTPTPEPAGLLDLFPIRARTV